MCNALRRLFHHERVVQSEGDVKHGPLTFRHSTLANH